jgi:opacity protein-like surface antigen
MSYRPIQLILTTVLALISIDKATAQDVSDLKMSFSDHKISVLPEQNIHESQPKQTVARNVQRDDRPNGWYLGTTRGASFPSLSATNTNTNVTSKANWNGVDFNNFNGFAGYKSSNFRIEGELLYASNEMTLDRQNTTAPVIGDLINNIPVIKENGVPLNCKATTFAAMLNGYYDIEAGGQIKPFVGGGIGFASTNLKDSGFDWGSASGFTYQFKAGVDYPLSDRQDVYVQYKYINAPAQYVKQDTNRTPFASTTFNYGSIEFGTKFNF